MMRSTVSHCIGILLLFLAPQQQVILTVAAAKSTNNNNRILSRYHYCRFGKQEREIRDIFSSDSKSKPQFSLRSTLCLHQQQQRHVVGTHHYDGTMMMAALLSRGGGSLATAIPVHHGGASSVSKNQAENHDDHLMSAPTAIANVLADLCPHGMLPIAYGMAAAGGTGAILATMIVLVFAALSWYSLISFARGARVVLEHPSQQSKDDVAVDEESLSAVWSKIISPRTAWIPDVGCVALTVGCLLFYSAFLGDLFGSLASTIMPPGSPLLLTKRWSVLLLLHAMPLLPLCLLPDLSSLQASSTLGLLGILYTVLFVGKRLQDGQYAPGGKFYNLMPARYQPNPQINFPPLEAGSPRPLGFVHDMPPFFAGRGLLILMNMCCVAYACHYNAVKYYMELKKDIRPKFGSVMATGIGGTALVFLSMMLLGYGSFGSHAQTLLLNNYHSTDRAATAARALTGLAILSGYPLMFAGLKAALFSLLKVEETKKRNTITKLVLACIAISACFVTEHELGTVIGIVGSVFGSIVIYIFPALLSNRLLTIKDSKGEALAKPFFGGEQIWNNTLILFGLVFCVLGTWISLKQ